MGSSLSSADKIATGSWTQIEKGDLGFDEGIFWIILLANIFEMFSTISFNETMDDNSVHLCSNVVNLMKGICFSLVI